MTDKERGAFICGGNKKANNYETLVTNLLSTFHSLGCNMSVKLHFLYSQFDRFPENLGTVSDEQGDRFHQDLKTIKERYQGRRDKYMMADYCWNMKRNFSEPVYK